MDFWGAGTLLISLSTQLVSRGAAAGEMGGTPSGADSSRLVLAGGHTRGRPRKEQEGGGLHPPPVALLYCSEPLPTLHLLGPVPGEGLPGAGAHVNTCRCVCASWSGAGLVPVGPQGTLQSSVGTLFCLLIMQASCSDPPE